MSCGHSVIVTTDLERLTPILNVSFGWLLAFKHNPQDYDDRNAKQNLGFGRSSGFLDI